MFQATGKTVGGITVHIAVHIFTLFVIKIKLDKVGEV